MDQANSMSMKLKGVSRMVLSEDADNTEQSPNEITTGSESSQLLNSPLGDLVKKGGVSINARSAT
jgi:hypothetical protein